MKWENGRESDNVEDRRGDAGGGGGGRGRGIAGGGIGIVLIAVVAMFLGVDPSMVMSLLGGGGQQGSAPTSQQAPAPSPPQGDQMAKFVSVVLADTEDTWSALFKQSGSQYRVPKLVLFRGAVQSACGKAQSAMGPFYCPGDQKVYIDLVFFDDLQRRFQAPGEFARAYVIAHEVGHHVQNLAGIADQVRRLQARSSQADGNRLQVGMELQADCFAGVWAGINANRIEPGDIEEGMRAANAIGDDKLMADAGRAPVESMFTHGTSEQRMEALKRGIQSKNPNSCNYLQGVQ